MTLEKDFSSLKEEFPQLFKNCYGGCEAGDGWHDLVRDLCIEIEKIAKEKGLTEEYPSVAQIKEKFGTLRVYIDNGCKEIYDAIDIAEEKSGIICEFCGKSAEVKKTSTGWLKCACGSCLEDRNRKKNES